MNTIVFGEIKGGEIRRLLLVRKIISPEEKHDILQQYNNDEFIMCRNSLRHHLIISET